MKFDFKNRIYVFDGGMGTMLQARGLKAGEIPEILNITNPSLITEIHREYVEAGADIITANTFGANRKKLSGKADLKEVITKGILNAKAANPEFTALDIGPIGAILAPMGTLSFDEAYDIFKEIVVYGSEAGADLIIIETFSDLLEAKAAYLAARENSSLPVFLTMTYQSDMRTFMGTTPEISASLFEAMGVDAVGINCSLGPKDLIAPLKKTLESTSLPVAVQPNAGLPKIENGETVFDVSADDFFESCKKMIDMGVSVIGGCCGTTPEYIRKIKDYVKDKKPVVRKAVGKCFITSRTLLKEAKESATLVVGERINPTGKKLLKEALRNRDFDYIYKEAINQEEAGADILDVNAGLPEIDEPKVLKILITNLQTVTSLPLQIDSSDIEAVEQAARIYCGRPVINSVNGKAESLETVLPVAKKYGCCVVGLTLDEGGIPEKGSDRFLIAQKIVKKAEEFGIRKEDIFIDCLTMSVSSNPMSARETLKAVRMVREKLGVKTILGVSNISFGLPLRELVTRTFLAEALGCGLNLPIINPMSENCMETVAAFKVLNCEDENAKEYIEKFAETGQAVKDTEKSSKGLKEAILSGLKKDCGILCEEMLKEKEPMEILNGYVIPALDEMGEKFEKGVAFLPQLMASAEAAKAAFDVIRSKGGESRGETDKKILLATVKGDIHDIGKNIVKMLLLNYGYSVIDMGRDVPPEEILKTVKEEKIKLVGLSALMTTTVKNMEETIALLREQRADCTIVVGGAVLNEEYAKMVGADFYAKDAAETAKFAGEFFKR